MEHNMLLRELDLVHLPVEPQWMETCGQMWTALS